jgi:hypothetical protein
MNLQQTNSLLNLPRQVAVNNVNALVAL